MEEFSNLLINLNKNVNLQIFQSEPVPIDIVNEWKERKEIGREENNPLPSKEDNWIIRDMMKMNLKQNNKILLVWEDGKITYYDEKSKLLQECNNQRLFEYLLTRVGTRKDCLSRYDSMGVSEENALRVIHSINGPENIDDWKNLFVMASGRRMSDLIFLSVED